MSIPLRALGWKLLGQYERETMKKYPKLVLVYPHTSNWDIYLCMLYRISDPVLKQRMRVLVGGYCMRGWQGSILRSWGAIPSSYRDVRGAGTTSKIVEALRRMDSFVLLISPKGTLEAADWRSGYYRIALETGAHIVCGGLDYFSHSLRFGVPFNPCGMELRDVEFKCKDQLSTIVPHYPSMAEYRLELPHSKVVPSVTSGVEFLILLILVLLVLVLVLRVPRITARS